jgi:hypothetical protein
MKNNAFTLTNRSKFRLLNIVAVLSLGLLCSCSDAVNNVSSDVNCRDYCSKKFNCADEEVTNSESKACISSCRDAIEDSCGNENQADANNKIAECVDKSCGAFWTCMVFETAPECFSFVSN